MLKWSQEENDNCRKKLTASVDIKKKQNKNKEGDGMSECRSNKGLTTSSKYMSKRTLNSPYAGSNRGSGKFKQKQVWIKIPCPNQLDYRTGKNWISPLNHKRTLYLRK